MYGDPDPHSGSLGTSSRLTGFLVSALDVSFGARPFALTNAVNGAVLLIAKLLLPAGT